MPPSVRCGGQSQSARARARSWQVGCEVRSSVSIHVRARRTLQVLAALAVDDEHRHGVKDGSPRAHEARPAAVRQSLCLLCGDAGSGGGVLATTQGPQRDATGERSVPRRCVSVRALSVRASSVRPLSVPHTASDAVAAMRHSARAAVTASDVAGAEGDPHRWRHGAWRCSTTARPRSSTAGPPRTPPHGTRPPRANPPSITAMPLTQTNRQTATAARTRPAAIRRPQIGAQLSEPREERQAHVHRRRAEHVPRLLWRGVSTALPAGLNARTRARPARLACSLTSPRFFPRPRRCRLHPGLPHQLGRRNDRLGSGAGPLAARGNATLTPHATAAARRYLAHSHRAHYGSASALRVARPTDRSACPQRPRCCSLSRSATCQQSPTRATSLLSKTTASRPCVVPPVRAAASTQRSAPQSQLTPLRMLARVSLLAGLGAAPVAAAQRRSWPVTPTERRATLGRPA